MGLMGIAALHPSYALLSAHYGRGLRVKGGCRRAADGAAGVPPASEVTGYVPGLTFRAERKRIQEGAIRCLAFLVTVGFVQ